MPYTDADFKRMHREPEFAKRYFWWCAMNARRVAGKLKRNINKTPDDLEKIENLERFSKSVLEHLDLLIESLGITK